uniref:Uncharacterized protein n=1 Tax=Amphimedon queenslandica TaxID=400682 RepID=A0A1X7U9B3_AMPQE
MNAMHKINIWELVSPSADRQAVGCKCIFKKRPLTDGTIICYKAPLVAQGSNKALIMMRVLHHL